MSNLLSGNSTSKGQPKPDHGQSEVPIAHSYSCPVCRRAARPGEMICYYCGKFLADSTRPDLIDTNVLTDPSAATFPCPSCQKPCSPGDPLCMNCGRLFVNNNNKDTDELDPQLPAKQLERWPLGEISVDDEQPILLEIDGKQIALPIASAVVLGRVVVPIDPEDKRPHTDLSAFNGHEHGVSREHAAVLRKHGLVYVIDLGSSNGTILNGNMLVPYSDRVMRSGDELQLGHLTMRVIFPGRVSSNKPSQNSAQING